MQSNPVPLRPSEHKGFRIKQLNSAEYMKDSHVAAVHAIEYLRAGLEYPIVFVKDPETKEYNSVVMWGIEAGENLFVQGTEWLGGFIPATARCYPFAMSISADDPNRLVFGIFEDAPMVSKDGGASKDEGDLMFNDDESETEWMKNIKNFLVSVFEQGQVTKNMLKHLDSLDLFTPQALSLKLPGEGQEKKIDGFFIIDREKLAELSDEKYLGLRKANVLEAIHAHIASLGNIEKLVKQIGLNNKAVDDADADK